MTRKLTEKQQANVRQLFRDGWSMKRIAAMFRLRVHQVKSVLKSAGLIERGHDPMLRYVPPEIWDDDDLTPRRREEMEAAAEVHFRLRVDYEMTVVKARENVALTVDALMERDGLTRERALYVMKKSAAMAMAARDGGGAD